MNPKDNIKLKNRPININYLFNVYVKVQWVTYHSKKILLIFAQDILLCRFVVIHKEESPDNVEYRTI